MTALWLVLISGPAEGRRLSWPGGGKTLKDEPRSLKAVSGGKFLVGGEGGGDSEPPSQSSSDVTYAS